MDVRSIVSGSLFGEKYCRVGKMAPTGKRKEMIWTGK